VYTKIEIRGKWVQFVVAQVTIWMQD